MKHKIFKVVLTDFERQIVSVALTELIKKQIEENKAFDFIKAIAEKFDEKPVEKRKNSFYEER